MRLPNREERRLYNKKHKTNYTMQDFALMYAVNGIQKGQDIAWLKPYLPTDMISHKDNWDLFPDGTKVKLDLQNIMARPAKYLNEDFKTWVVQNQEEEFTIYRDQNDENRKGLIGIRYVDETKNTDFSNALLFDLYSDLVVWSDLENNYVSAQKIEDLTNNFDNVKQSLAMYDGLDNIFDSDTTEYFERIQKIRDMVRAHEQKTEVISDPLEWENIDSELQMIIEHITELPAQDQEQQLSPNDSPETTEELNINKTEEAA